MKTLLLLLLLAATGQAQSTETLVLIGHGEKPETEIGQINAQGLSRALALPDVLAAKFLAPQSINPSTQFPKPAQT